MCSSHVLLPASLQNFSPDLSPKSHCSSSCFFLLAMMSLLGVSFWTFLKHLERPRYLFEVCNLPSDLLYLTLLALGVRLASCYPIQVEFLESLGVIKSCAWFFFLEFPHAWFFFLVVHIPDWGPNAQHLGSTCPVVGYQTSYKLVVPSTGQSDAKLSL